jgi:hypothetical protein
MHNMEAQIQSGWYFSGKLYCGVFLNGLYYIKIEKMTMNKLGKFGLIAFVLLIVSYSNGQTKSETETQKTTEMIDHVIPEFDIQFPETNFKVEKTESRTSSFGNILVTNWILQGKDENGPFMYFVSHNEYPQVLKDAEKIVPNSLEVAFQSMLTSSAVKLGGTDFEYTNIEYKGFKGMESICKVFNGEGIIKSRIYKINNDLFMISAGGRKINIETVDKFLNSFGLKK